MVDGTARGSTRRVEGATHDPTIAILGLGYVGLPTALSARAGGANVIGIDHSEGRLKAIRDRRVDLVPDDQKLLGHHLDDGDGFILTSSPQAVADADAVLICVPTPVDEHRNPDLRMLSAACADAVRHARRGQTLILTSTSYPGTTRDLLALPLAARGFTVGEDIFVASSPERIDPGNPMRHADVPRVVGGMTPRCLARAAAIVRLVADEVVTVSSAEAAEMTKLLENSFRAVNIAFANEVADVCETLGVDAREVIDAAATKPYGFMPFYPGTGVGGHCIPCDPHYLLWELRSRHAAAPILSEAMEAIASRPHVVVDAIGTKLSAIGRGIGGSRVLVVGVAYKPGIEDARESPGIEVVKELRHRGATVDYYDPLVPAIRLDGQSSLLSVKRPEPGSYDVAVLHALHPGVDYRWLEQVRMVFDPAGGSGYGRDEPPAERRMVAETRAALSVGD
jgi:nucleotide sugar dehydrogenase